MSTFKPISVVVEGMSVGGEAHRPFTPDQDTWITWPEIGRRYFKGDQDYSRLLRFGFPQGRQGYGAGGLAPRPEMKFKRRDVEQWLADIRDIASTVKAK